MIELACETDFVAKNEQFQELAGDIVAHAAKVRPATMSSAAGRDAGRRQDRRAEHRGAQRRHRREDRAARRGRASTARSPPTCTAGQRPAARRSACSWRSRARRRGDEAARGAAMQVARMPPQYVSPGRGAGRAVENERSDRRGHRARGGQARAGPAQDHRGSGQRLLQGGRAARAAVRAGAQEDGQGRCSTKPARRSPTSPVSRSAPEQQRRLVRDRRGGESIMVRRPADCVLGQTGEGSKSERPEGRPPRQESPRDPAR